MYWEPPERHDFFLRIVCQLPVFQSSIAILIGNQAAWIQLLERNLAFGRNISDK